MIPNERGSRHEDEQAQDEARIGIENPKERFRKASMHQIRKFTMRYMMKLPIIIQAPQRRGRFWSSSSQTLP
jgi:hypothetical protein